MTNTVKRTRTGHKGIYFNESTRKYDVKFCYTVFDPDLEKNAYKQKWTYNLPNITEAKSALIKLRSESEKPKSSSVTLSEALELWETKAAAQNLSPVTIENTRSQFKIICRILPEDLCVSDITEDTYYSFASECRSLGYSDESIAIINGTLRKLINLCYKKRLLTENVLDYCDNIKTTKKQDYRIIPKQSYERIDEYFAGLVSPRSNPEYVSKYRLLFSLLFFTGIRIGEALALTYDDIEECRYLVGGSPVIGKHLVVSKSYVQSMKITKTPKNYKHRTIPLHPHPVSLYEKAKAHHIEAGGSPSDRIITMTYTPIDKALKKACRTLCLPLYHCHEFRHTYISYLISKNVPISVIEKVSGDTQQTILSRYSHCFSDAESIVWNALNEI